MVERKANGLREGRRALERVPLENEQIAQPREPRDRSVHLTARPLQRLRRGRQILRRAARVRVVLRRQRARRLHSADTQLEVYTSTIRCTELLI